MTQQPFLQKLTLRNFRSIRSETVTFANPLFLVGRNGSGKSNFVRALSFLSDCMTLPLLSAFGKNGNLWNSHASSAFYTPPIELRLDFQISRHQNYRGRYYFSIGLSDTDETEVINEQCVVQDEEGHNVWFNRERAGFRTNAQGVNPAVNPQSLALPVVAGVAEFSPLLDALSAMRVYAIKPSALSQIQEPSGNSFLTGDGSNSVSVLRKLFRQDGWTMKRVCELLAPIAPGITTIEPLSLVNNQLLLLIAQAGKDDNRVVMDAAAMSDGTLSALGIIIAAIQDPAPSLIAIEEPELNIHPGALEAIADILNIAAQRTQVVVTTHSPDLLDTKWVQPENLRVVEWEKGATRISELGEAPVQALRQHLMGAGELLRADALDAAPPSATDSEDVPDLFDKDLA